MSPRNFVNRHPDGGPKVFRISAKVLGGGLEPTSRKPKLKLKCPLSERGTFFCGICGYQVLAPRFFRFLEVACRIF